MRLVGAWDQPTKKNSKWVAPKKTKQREKPAEFRKVTRDEKTWYGSKAHTEGRAAKKGKS